MFVAWGGNIPTPSSVVRLIPKTFPEDYNHHGDPDHEDSNQKLLQNTPAIEDAPLYHGWLQMIQKFRRYGTNN